MKTTTAAALSGCVWGKTATVWADAVAAPRCRVATFRCDITPPLGEPQISCDLVKTVEQPLLAKGVVFEADGQRYVLCALDWCELTNGSYDDFCNRVAKAAGTDASRVAVQSVHQHTAPVVDMEAHKLLAAAGVGHLQLSPQAYETIAQRLAQAVEASLAHFQPCDRIGVGQAKVDRVASSRRPLNAAGKLCPRMSFTADAALRALPEGKIDPYLKTITFAQGDKPLARLHYYATHPQTRYGDGRASSDMVGDAREALERKEGVFQVYFNGCGGDITVGKYNDGTPQGRAELAGRLMAGMEAALAATTYAPIGRVEWRVCPVVFPRRTDAGYCAADCRAKITNTKLGLVERMYAGGVRTAFHEREKTPIALSSLKIGEVHIVHLPGEPMIDFQFYAQSLLPHDFVAVAGYGDCGTGYICPARAFTEGGYEPTASCVKPEAEDLLRKALVALLPTK